MLGSIPLWLKDFQLKQLSTDYVELANRFQGPIENMGLYGVDVFQKTLSFLANEEFRRANAEQQKQVLWNKLKPDHTVRNFFFLKKM